MRRRWYGAKTPVGRLAPKTPSKKAPKAKPKKKRTREENVARKTWRIINKRKAAKKVREQRSEVSS